MTSVHEEPPRPIVIAGAGPHGLATAIHLLTAAPRLRERLVVVDPTGAWMTVWREQFARLDIANLRSPAVHHPAPQAGRLMDHTATYRLATSVLPYGLPTTTSFERFCDHMIEHHEIESLVTKGTVVGVDVCAGNDGQQQLDVTLHTDAGGSTMRAERLVIASNPCHPVVPEWATNAPSGVVEAAAQVDVRVVDDRDRILIVGAGLTAVHLACAAARRGAHVTIVCRGEMTERAFDTDPGWLGPKELDRYHAIESPHTRLRVARQARGCGTAPSWILRELRDLEQAGAVAILERCEVTDVDSDPGSPGGRFKGRHLRVVKPTRCHGLINEYQNAA